MKINIDMYYRYYEIKREIRLEVEIKYQKSYHSENYYQLENVVAYEMDHIKLPLKEKLQKQMEIIKHYQSLLEDQGLEVTLSINDNKINSSASASILVQQIIEEYEITSEELEKDSIAHNYSKRPRAYTPLKKRLTMTEEEKDEAIQKRDKERLLQKQEVRENGVTNTWYGDLEDFDTDPNTGYPVGYDENIAYISYKNFISKQLQKTKKKI